MVKKITYSLITLIYLIVSTGFVVNNCECNKLAEQTKCVRCAKSTACPSGEKSCAADNNHEDCCPSEFVSMEVDASQATNFNFPVVSLHIVESILTLSSIEAPAFTVLNTISKNSYINRIPIIYLNCKLRL